MRSRPFVALTLLLLLLTALQTRGTSTPLLTVTCAAPQGVDMSYGSGLLGLRTDRVETASVAYPDRHLIFVLEDDTSQRLLVSVSAQATRQGPPEPSIEASILYNTDDQITAVAPRGESVAMYSLFPKLGMGYFVTHDHIPFGYTSRSVATYARCQVVRREPQPSAP